MRSERPKRRRLEQKGDSDRGTGITWRGKKKRGILREKSGRGKGPAPPERAVGKKQYSGKT